MPQPSSRNFLERQPFVPPRDVYWVGLASKPATAAS